MLSAEEGVASAHAFCEALSKGKCDAVWDVRQMTGYDTAARVAWQTILWPVRKHIASLEVVGAKGLVKLGAISLGIVLGVRWKLS